MTKLIKVIQPNGVLEQESAIELQQSILKTIADADGILVDFSQVRFMTSAGLGGLATVYTKLRKMGKDLFLCSLNDQVRIIFELTAMDGCFKIFVDRSAFEQQIASLEQVTIG